jgi:riboflavin synthase
MSVTVPQNIAMLKLPATPSKFFALGTPVFTGLVQALGTVRLQDRYHLNVNCTHSSLLTGLAIGDSVAVDGACLTVETILEQGFIVTVSPETLERTILSQKSQTGARVNLEPALRVGDRLGGHFVTGHVDGLGALKAIDSSGSSWQLWFQSPTAVTPYLVPKGSIAVNGISLTVAECDPAGTWFSIAVIPHSFAQTNLQDLQVGDAVNLEADLLGKYAAKLLQHRWAPLDSSAQELNLPDIPEITTEYLTEHGFG